MTTFRADSRSSAALENAAATNIVTSSTAQRTIARSPCSTVQCSMLICRILSKNYFSIYDYNSNLLSFIPPVSAALLKIVIRSFFLISYLISYHCFYFYFCKYFYLYLHLSLFRFLCIPLRVSILLLCLISFLL